MTRHIVLPAQVQTALERLWQNGFSAYTVGGCVRDFLLGKQPNDWDLTTSARPEETLRVFGDCRVIETGIKHGTVTVILGGLPMEITTYRADGEYLDNRHPCSVSFSEKLEDDLSRRDFTVNAMAYSPQGGFCDLFDGKDDLSRRVIRCVGDADTRFHEDGLRILRAIRFASVLDFTIAPETEKAVHECRELLRNIAAERVREEFCKLLCGRGAVRILREYPDVVGVFLPELFACVGFEQNSKYHDSDVYEHTLRALEEAPEDLITRLAVLFHDVGKPPVYTEDERGGHFKGHAKVSVEMTDEIFARLRFDKDTTARVRTLVEIHDLPIEPTPKSVKRLMRRLYDDDILRLLEIQRCDRLAHAEAYRALPEYLFEIPRVIQEIRAAGACLSLKDLLLGGDDLRALGMKPGKEMGELLSALLEDVIDEKLPNDRALLLAEAKKRITKKNE